MGIEDYRVSLRTRAATAAVVSDWVRERPHAAPDEGLLPDHCEYFRIDDGRHVLEVEVSRTDPAEVTVRFALCNPRSVEAAFLAFVRELATTFEMKIHDQEGHGTFPPEAVDRFAASALESIARRRAEWVAQFGPRVLAAGSREVFETIILPQCAPLVPRHAAVG